jgi:hypothetical protein
MTLPNAGARFFSLPKKAGELFKIESDSLNGRISR